MRLRTKIKWGLTVLAALAVGVVVTAYAILASMNLDDWRGVIEAEAKSATGRTLSIGGPVDLRFSLTPAITIENVTFGNAPWGTWPELLSIRRLDVEVRLLPLLTGDIEVRRLRVIEPTILLETSTDGKGNWVIDGPEAETSTSDETGPTTIPAFHRIDVRDGNLLFHDGATGKEYKVALNQLDASAKTPASLSEISLVAIYNGVAVEAEGTLASRDQLLSGAAFPLDLRVNAAKTTIKMSGKIADPAAARGIDLQIDVQGERLADLNPLTGEDLPALGPYTLAARLSDVKAGYKLTGLAATLGASNLAGNVTVALDGPRPKIAGTLNSTNIDVADFQKGTEPAAPTTDKAGGKRFLLSDDPLPLDALSAVDANINLTADQMRFDERANLADVSMILDLNAGRARIFDLSAVLSGGLVSGTLSLDASAGRPPITVDLSAKGFDYGQFLQKRDITDGVSGNLDATVRLAGAGGSLHAWASSLDGRIDLVGGEGRVRSDLLSAGGAGLINMFSGWREGDNDLRLNCVVMRLPVKDGVVGTDAVLVDTAAVTVGVRGTVDLRDESLNLKVTPQAKRTSLMSLAVPLRISGTLSEPSVGPDPLGTAVGAAKIAGMFLNPLVAGAVIVLDSEMTDQNPCVAAIEKPGAGSQKKEAPSSAERAIEETGGALKNAGEEAGKTLKDAGTGAGEALKDAGEGAGEALKDAGEGVKEGLRSIFNK